MEQQLLRKATFEEVYHLLEKEPNSDIFQCFKSLFDVALLFFPACICQETASIIGIADLATGATLVGAGISAIVGNAAKNAFQFFKHKNHGDYAARYEQMQIAHVMVVYAAYFDTISRYLPNENGEIVLSPDVKCKISKSGFDRYLKNIKKKAQAEKSMPRLLTDEFILPSPTQKFSRYKDGLEKFYDALNIEFRSFFDQTSFWKEISKENDDLDRDQIEYFSDLIYKLPKAAVHTYEQQYYELSNEFPEFAIWANSAEHERIETQIDIGFRQMSVMVKQLLHSQEFRENEVSRTLGHYKDKYEKYINMPVIEDKEGDFDKDIVFPAQRDIFVPQAFQALTYHEPMQLEHSDTWKEAFAGEEIGCYIRSILSHPKYGEFPMVILGHPGAGKTLLCHMLAAQILSEEYYVIIIKLRNAAAEDTIIKQINAQIEEDLGENCSWNDMRNASLDKPFLFIFDGYDELLQASGKTYSNYLNQIAEFQEDQRSIYHVFVRCIITSRTTLIDKASIPKNSHILRLSDFDDDRIHAWCGIWNQKNERYFREREIDRLEIASDGKIRELAGQPLLLLMLALYEINGNHLQEQECISRAELYYKLILDFVEREKGKDGDFYQMTKQKQRDSVRDGFRYLGIAALGMYNRKKLFIRTSELNKDLAFLVRGYQCIDDADEYALEDGDKLLGSFFFVHSSKSNVQVSDSRTKIMAYEFLHNTFNEFLTAYYILDITFRIIKRQIKDMDQGEIFSWPEHLQKEWHTSLAYAPLFMRPVVVNMIHELSVIIAKESAIECERVREALNSLFSKEIHRIITGDIFAELNRTLTMQGNPFKHPELMLHVASYSINLILLRVIVCADSFAFTKELGAGGDWQKLTHIWRYAYSEEELVNLSAILEQRHVDGEYYLSYRYDEETANHVALLSKIDRLSRIAGVFGDDAAYAVLGAFGYTFDNDVFPVLEKEGLKIKTKYALNAVFRSLILPEIYGRDLKQLLYHVLECCERERDLFGFYVFYALLNSLIKQRTIDGTDASYLLNRETLHILDSVIGGHPFRSGKWRYISIIYQEIINYVYALPDKRKYAFLDELVAYYSYQIRNSARDMKQETDGYILNIFGSLCSLLQFVAKKNRLRKIGVICCGLANIQGLYRSFTAQEIIMLLQLCGTLEKAGDYGHGMEIFDNCTHLIAKRYFDIVYDRQNAALCSALVESYYYQERIYFQKTHQLPRALFMEEYFQKVGTMRILLPAYEQSFYYLLCLLGENVLSVERMEMDVESDLKEIIRKFGKRLSVRTLKKIIEYARRIHLVSVCSAAEKLIK